VGLASTLTLLAVSNPPGAWAAPADDVGAWTVKDTAAGPHDQMFGLGVVSPDDIWVVGRTENGLSGSPLWSEHWDGSQWTAVEVPPDPNLPYTFLSHVAVVSSDEVWASGAADDGGTSPVHGLLRLWDGTAWTAVDVPHAGTWSNYAGLAFSGRDDGWLVGASAPGVTGRPTSAILDHWDGSSWTEASVPSTLCDGAESFLYDVTAIAATDAWAVGSCGDPDPWSPLVLHWDGLTWTQVAVPVPPGANLPFLEGMTALATDDVWAVGTQQTKEPLIAHWDGTSWTDVASPAQSEVARLESIVAVSAGDLWAVGDLDGDPLIEHWDGSSWAVVDGVTPLASNQQLTDIVALPGGTLWVVGYNMFEQMTEAPVGDSGFLAPTAGGRLGSPVTWRFPSTNRAKHSVTDATGCALFDSGQRARGRSFVYRYTAAGTFTVRDGRTGTSEKVRVVPLATRAAGKLSVRWAVVPGVSGFLYDVQVRLPGSSSWDPWQHGVTTTSGQFAPTASGTYSFRARVRNPGRSCSSGWSPAASITA
jgi:hypothetical protein